MRKTVCLHAAQAGTGKTHLTANLAVELVWRGHHVGVLDADMLTPGLHTLFDLPAHTVQQTINDYVWDEAELAACIYDLTPHLPTQSPNAPPSGGTLRLIPANPTARSRDRILSEGYAVNLMVKALRDLINTHHIDILLIDTHPGFDQNTLLTACSARLMLVTTTPDRQHLDNTAYLMDRLRRVNEPSMALVVNQMNHDDALKLAEYGTRCGLSIATGLPTAPLLQDTSDSNLFLLQQPAHIWSSKIARLADFITAGR